MLLHTSLNILGKRKYYIKIIVVKYPFITLGFINIALEAVCPLTINSAMIQTTTIIIY